MNIAKWKPFGGQQPPNQPVQIIKPPVAVDNSHLNKIGLTNFGNTCYANSVLQALYFCGPFRDLLLQTSDHSVSPETLDAPQDVQQLQAPTLPQTPLTPVRRKPDRKASYTAEPAQSIVPTTAPIPPPPMPTNPPSLFSALRSLFDHVHRQRTDRGKVAPQAFINKLRELNELFRSTQHQDAHEFLNYLLNKVAEELEEEKITRAQDVHLGEDLASSVTTLQSKSQNSSSGTAPEDATLVQKLFEGVLTSETRCLTCETVSSRDECFLDLSIDIEQNSSVSACLRQFSASEMLCHTNKFFCDSCCDLQEAEKRMKIKRLPNVLALHLKRFKYQEDVQKYIKLAYRVAFPYELRLFNTADDADDADRLYELFGINVHIGSGPHHGHYISIIKTNGNWFVFDDETVEPIKENEIPKYFGDSSSSAYVLYYQAVDIDPVKLGLRPTASVSSVGETFEQNLSVPVESSASDKSAPILPPGLVASPNGSALEPQRVLSPLPIEKTPGGELVIDTSPTAFAPASTGVSADSPVVPSTPSVKPASSKTSLFKRTPSHSKSLPSRKPSVDIPPSAVPPVPTLPPPPTSVASEPAKAPPPKSPVEKEKKSWFKRSKTVKDKRRSETLPPDLVVTSIHDKDKRASYVPPLVPEYTTIHVDTPEAIAGYNTDTSSQRHSVAGSISDITIPPPAIPVNGSESPLHVSHPHSSASSTYPVSPSNLPPPPINTFSVPSSPMFTPEKSPRKSTSAAPISAASNPKPSSPTHKKSLSRFFPSSSHHESNGDASKSKRSQRPATADPLMGTGSATHTKGLPPLPPLPPADRKSVV